MTRDRILEKERKELAKWKAEEVKPMGKLYMPMLIVIIAIVYLLDALASDLHAGLQDLQYTFFANQAGTTYDVIASRFSYLGVSALLINIISPFYKALADKWGRKALFAISTAGMGIGLLLGIVSTNVYVYWIGRIILSFFIAADIQVVYIMEISKPEMRARLFGITKFISQLGILIIPVCRDLLLNEDGSNWQMVCIVPAIIAAVTTILIILFVRESGPFMNSRIKHLEIPYEERMAREEQAKKDKSVASGKVGIGPAFKYIFRNKSIRAVLLAMFFVLLASNAFVGYHTTIWVKSGMSLAQRTTALYCFPVVAACITLIGGFVSDKMGRKFSICLFAGLSLAGLVAYILTASPELSPLVTGSLFGLCYGAFWTTGDSIGMLLSESVKTELRSSTSAAFGFAGIVAYMLSMLAFGIIFGIVGEVFLPICLGWGVVCMSIVLFVVLTQAKETKGIDINEAGADTT